MNHVYALLLGFIFIILSSLVLRMINDLDREKILEELLRKASTFVPPSPLSQEIEAVLHEAYLRDQIKWGKL